MSSARASGTASTWKSRGQWVGSSHCARSATAGSTRAARAAGTTRHQHDGQHEEHAAGLLPHFPGFPHLP